MTWDDPASLATYAWTVHEQVKDALDVPYETWVWLLGQNRHPAVVVGTIEEPFTYYQASALVSDPDVDVLGLAADAGVVLPTVGPPIAAWNLRLQPEWEVRLWMERGDLDYPFARVRLIPSASPRGGGLWYETTQPLSIECYPEPTDDAEKSLLVATQVQDILIDAFWGRGVGVGRSIRVPLWDYDGVELDEESSVRNASDYLSVVDYSSRPLPDPVDPRRVAVVADLRVRWRTDAHLQEHYSRDERHVKGTRTVESVQITIEGG